MTIPEIQLQAPVGNLHPADWSRLCANPLTRKIEETLQYPGEIKVTVVRETRATAVAH